MLRVHQLEMAKGYDGLLRGMPEPTMLIGVYRVDGGHARALARYLYRFKRPGGFPTKVTTTVPSDEVLAFRPSTDSRIAVLALALEEDDGRGLQSLYAQLEDADGVLAWTDDDVAPVPTHLPELSGGPMPPDHARRIHLMFGEHDPSRHLEGDDWIDANLLWTSIALKRLRHRLHFVSADGRNDWTAEVEILVRTA